MTKSTITRERIEQYANDPRMCNINDEIRELARMALAALDTEQVKYNIGDATMFHIFTPTGMTNISDFQAVFDRVEVVLSSIASAPMVTVTDSMAYAFHHALTDGPLGDEDVEDIKIGLRAAFANVITYQPLPVVLKEHQIRELVNKLRDIAIEYHGTQQLREHIACVVRAAMFAVAQTAPKSEVN